MADTNSQSSRVAEEITFYQECPLVALNEHDKEEEMGLQRVVAIERHVSAPGNCAHPPLNKLKMEGRLRGSTPLLLAAAQGDLVVAKRITENWGINVNATAQYHTQLDNEIYPIQTRSYEIRGAAPLFVAAVNGHDAIVRYLVGKGANISAITKSSYGEKYAGMSPLYGALNLIDRHEDSLRKGCIARPLREKKTDVVRFLLEMGAKPSALDKYNFPNWMTNLCNSNTTAISALICHGMRLDQRNPSNGDTVLHHWAANPLASLMESRTEEESPLVVVKLLVEKGADIMAKDENGFTPILRAARAFLTHTSRENLSIVDFLLENEAIDRKEKIDALELIGAIILGDPGNAHLFQKGFDCWRRALRLREMEKKGFKRFKPLPKTVMERKSGLTAEWATSAELERAYKNPSEYPLQAILVKLRIYSSRGLVVAKSFLNEYWKIRSIEKQRKPIDLNLLDELAILDMIFSFQPEQEDETWGTTLEVVSNITRSIVDILKSNPGDALDGLTSKTIKISLELIVASEKHHFGSNSYRENIDDQMWTLFHLFEMLATLPEKLIEEFKPCLVPLVKFKRPSTYTLLHMACRPTGDRARLSTISLLLKSGADPNAGDFDGNGPLHLLLSSLYRYDDEDYAIIRLLLNEGSHLDRVNKNGETAVDLWNKEKDSLNSYRLRLDRAPLDRLPDWCYESVPKLMCLSSRAVRSFKLPYTAGTIPISLIKYVDMH